MSCDEEQEVINILLQVLEECEKEYEELYLERGQLQESSEEVETKVVSLTETKLITSIETDESNNISNEIMGHEQTCVNNGDWFQSSNQSLVEQNNNLQIENEKLSIKITEAINENEIIKLHMEEYSARHTKSERQVLFLVDEIESLREQHRHTSEFLDLCYKHGIIIDEKATNQYEYPLLAPNYTMRRVESLAKELLLEKEKLQNNLNRKTIELNEAVQFNNEITQVLGHLREYVQKVLSEKRDLEVRIEESLTQNNLWRPKWFDKPEIILSEATSTYIGSMKENETRPVKHHFISTLVN